MKNLPPILLISIIISLTYSPIFSQNISVGIGSWREHTPFIKALTVAENNNGLIYCATQFGIFTYSKNDGELNIHSRLNELSDLEVATIRFDYITGVLFIAYDNSNIDMILPNKNIVNIPDIKQKNIVGGKHINSIFFLDRFAYLSSDFGIIVVDIDRQEIKDTYYIGPNGTNIIVNSVTYDGTYLIAATNNGIYKSNYNDPNIFNYTAWSKDSSLAEPNAKYTSTTSLNGKIYAVKTSSIVDRDTVLVFDNNVWLPFYNNSTSGAFIDSYNNKLVYRNKYAIKAFDTSGNELRNIDIFSYANADIRHGLLDNEGNFWIADFQNGLVRVRSDNTIEMISPNGPRSEASWALAGSKGKLWVASGSLSGSAPSYEIKNGISRFNDNIWQTFDCTNDSLYYQLCASGSKSVVCVAIDPADPYHAFIGSWENGLLEYRKDGGVNRYTESNSSLQSFLLNPGHIRVGGLAYDDDKNLWVVAGGNSNGISVMKNDATWQSFVIPEIAVAAFDLYSLVVDDFGQKWFIAHAGASIGEGVCVFKEESLTNPNNGSFKRLSDREGSGALPSIFVRAIAKDKDGSIWVGTDKGVAVIYNPGNVFSGGNYDAQKIILQQDGYNQYLLETEIVTSIVIDGANRKWIGTYSGGAFLMSADGTKQIHNFSRENSPLSSNTILCIAIDDLTGEVFFGTDKGIISYRSDATEGGETCSNYYVFPNPVRHDYHGPIAIRGLVPNADVKIADVAGNVVYHTKANGGEAVWNGNNFKGERAQTGVYIVFITNEDGSQTCTTKMLFAN